MHVPNFKMPFGFPFPLFGPIWGSETSHLLGKRMIWVIPSLSLLYSKSYPNKRETKSPFFPTSLSCLSSQSKHNVNVTKPHMMGFSIVLVLSLLRVIFRAKFT